VRPPPSCRAAPVPVPVQAADLDDEIARVQAHLDSLIDDMITLLKFICHCLLKRRKSAKGMKRMKHANSTRDSKRILNFRKSLLVFRLKQLNLNIEGIDIKYEL
jgi:hypothetical protein